MNRIPSILILAIALAVPALAQESKNAPAAAQPAPPPPGDRPNFEQMRERWNEQLKTLLKVNADEWTVLQPLIEKVQTTQRESMAGRFGGFPGRGGNNPPNASGARPLRPGQAESEALRETLQKDVATPDEIKAKLAAVRDVQKKAAANLEAARAELRKVVSVRQEAALVSMGILD